MAFEIVSKQRRAVATSKAQEMARRGVKRIFCIDLNTTELLEWAGKAWSTLGEDDLIEDVCLSQPLSARAILHSAANHDEVVKALHQRGNAYIESLMQAERERLLIRLCEKRLGRALHDSERALLRELSSRDFDAFYDRLLDSDAEAIEALFG